ncbi:hypothetical protein CEXT_572951 [Caerostris extrusa]|uniref:Uncharacterized protein n=1 Tax=Caerostris extrusa TaxID=172846 RepID=A0AAV4XU80_CAEEX|nr:hypothetical protein CEXT_572951 [Caerostris extrusa]
MSLKILFFAHFQDASTPGVFMRSLTGDAGSPDCFTSSVVGPRNNGAESSGCRRLRQLKEVGEQGFVGGGDAFLPLHKSLPTTPLDVLPRFPFRKHGCENRRGLF